jgi:putative addiction module CopG family antidote
MARQTTLNVSLTPRLREYVRRKVQSGRYESASEVIRDSLRALEERDRAAAGFWDGVRAKVRVARGQVTAGRTLDGATAMDGLLAELDANPTPPKRKRATR